MVIRSDAPARIDLAGGTLDIWPLSVIVPEALTVNVGVELRASVSIEPRRDRRVELISVDRKRRASRELPLTARDIRGSLALLLRLVRTFEPRSGLTLRCEARAPAGAGLGGSSALGIALAAALARWTGRRMAREALVRRVVNVEAAELGVPTGNQDQLGAVYGGLHAYRYGSDGTHAERLPLSAALERRLVLVYSGGSRRSGMSNWDMFRRFVEGERRTVERLERIAGIARELADALRAGDLDAAGRLLGEEGRLRFSLAPTVATPALRKIAAAARRAGALGVKVCGAGGGGCMVALAADGREAAVAAAMARAGGRVLDARLARRGVRVKVG